MQNFISRFFCLYSSWDFHGFPLFLKNHLHLSILRLQFKALATFFFEKQWLVKICLDKPAFSFSQSEFRLPVGIENHLLYSKYSVCPIFIFMFRCNVWGHPVVILSIFHPVIWSWVGTSCHFQRSMNSKSHGKNLFIEDPYLVGYTISHKGSTCVFPDNNGGIVYNRGVVDTMGPT